MTATQHTSTAEQQRLQERFTGVIHPWYRWGPYVSERSWGTVREDYSANGEAWNYFPHDLARSKAYRWGEDGLAGLCDRYQILVFALALWNGKDPILKERLFGLVPDETNHGEDVKEYYFYLDSTPTHSYMKYLYKYPQEAYPYQKLIEESRKRAEQGEYELLDTGIFATQRYFDVFVEYAKAGPEDLCIRIEVCNRGPEPAPVHVIPHLWFRNRWAWGPEPLPQPSISLGPRSDGCLSLLADDSRPSRRRRYRFPINWANATCMPRPVRERSSPTTKRMAARLGQERRAAAAGSRTPFIAISSTAKTVSIRSTLGPKRACIMRTCRCRHRARSSCACVSRIRRWSGPWPRSTHRCDTPCRG